MDRSVHDIRMFSDVLDGIFTYLSRLDLGERVSLVNRRFNRLAQWFMFERGPHFVEELDFTGRKQQTVGVSFKFLESVACMRWRKRVKNEMVNGEFFYLI